MPSIDSYRDLRKAIKQGVDRETLLERFDPSGSQRAIAHRNERCYTWHRGPQYTGDSPSDLYCLPVQDCEDCDPVDPTSFQSSVRAALDDTTVFDRVVWHLGNGNVYGLHNSAGYHDTTRFAALVDEVIVEALEDQENVNLSDIRKCNSGKWPNHLTPFSLGRWFANRIRFLGLLMLVEADLFDEEYIEEHLDSAANTALVNTVHYTARKYGCAYNQKAAALAAKKLPGGESGFKVDHKYLVPTEPEPEERFGHPKAA